MKVWHALAAVSGSIVTVAMALASVSYNTTLGSAEPAFRWLLFLTHKHLFAALALAFDLGMIASTFAYLHWRRASPMRARICAVLFLIASAFSVHSVRGYIAMNVLAATAPARRTHDLYRSLTREIDHDLDHLAALRSTMLKAPRRRRRTLAREATRIEGRIKET